MSAAGKTTPLCAAVVVRVLEASDGLALAQIGNRWPRHTREGIGHGRSWTAASQSNSRNRQWRRRWPLVTQSGLRTKPTAAIGRDPLLRPAGASDRKAVYPRPAWSGRLSRREVGRGTRLCGTSPLKLVPSTRHPSGTSTHARHKQISGSTRVSIKCGRQPARITVAGELG
jgi:hypothetical protein